MAVEKLTVNASGRKRREVSLTVHFSSDKEIHSSRLCISVLTVVLLIHGIYVRHVWLFATLDIKFEELMVYRTLSVHVALVRVLIPARLGLQFVLKNSL